MPTRHLFTMPLILAVLAAGPALAQQDSALAPPPNVTEFEPMEFSVDRETYRENVRRTTAQLREANAVLRAYLRASMQAIMQGHSRSFASFRTWYRRRDARLRSAAAQRQIIARIFTAGLSQSLNFALPGSGVFVSALRGGLSEAYSEALSQISSFEGGDPDLFLARQQEAIEAVRSDYLARADSIADDLDRAFEDLKWEYVLEYKQDPTATDTDPSPHIRRIAAHYGIPQPNKATIDRVALAVLESHINGVLAQDSDFLQGYLVSNRPTPEAYVSATARVKAYRQFHAGQPDRYFPVEIELFRCARLGVGTECRHWQSMQR